MISEERLWKWFFFIGIFLLVSCSQAPETGRTVSESDTASKDVQGEAAVLIELDTETKTAQAFEKLSEAAGEAPARILIEQEGYAASGGSTFEIAARILFGPASGTEGIILKRRYFAPTAYIWDEIHDIASETLSGLSEERILPIEDIRPPLKALTIDGRGVDAGDYPLKEDYAAHLEIYTDDPSLKEELHSWYEKLEETAKELFPLDPPYVLTVGGVGDMMLGRGIEDILISRGDRGLSYIFSDTLPVLRSQDVLIGNLEGAVTLGGTKIPKSYNFRFRPEVLPRLKEAGFDYLSITNNHCYDYGMEGFLDTLDYLERYDIPTSGAGRTEDEAYRPHTEQIFKGGRKTEVRILSVAAYPREKNGFDGRSRASVQEDRPGIIFSGAPALEAIASFSSDDSIDIVAIHGGQEWQNYPVADQVSFYRSCIDSGADLVLGSHPHVLQGIEGYNGGLIAYSLGNFLFPGMYVMPFAEESLILSVGFVNAKPLYVRPYPVRIDNRRIGLDKDGRILPRYLELSRKLAH